MTKVTVLAFPKQHDSNLYIYLLYDSVEPYGVTVLNGNIKQVCIADYDVAHYHWPESFLNDRSIKRRILELAKFTVKTLAIKVRGKKIIWTMHNVEGHEESGTFLPWLFRVLLFWATDGLIALSAISYQIMMEKYPSLRSKPFSLSWIGDYRKCYPTVPTKGEAKERLGLKAEQFTIGFFGIIRPYKNVQHLIRIFKQLPDAHLKLLIVGQCPDKLLAAELRELAGDDPRIDLRLIFLNESEVPWLMRAVDLVVLPFHAILNSSSAMLSLSFDVPILVPAKGSLIEIAQNVGDEWVYTYQDVLTTDILADAIARATVPRTTQAPLEDYNWRDCGRITAEFYQKIANK